MEGSENIWNVNKFNDLDLEAENNFPKLFNLQLYETYENRVFYLSPNLSLPTTFRPI